MEYTTNSEIELIEILKKHSFNYTFKILERDDLLFLPIQFSVKHNYDFYPCIFGFYSQLFDEELFKNLFTFPVSHLEAIDKNNFIIRFAFQNMQRLI